MKRVANAFANIALAAAMLGIATVARAQVGTPPAEATGVEVAPGVTFALLPASEDPPSLYRLNFAPGATLQFAGDPAISLVYVESGALELELDATVRDTRPDTPGEEAIQALGQGAYFVLPPQVAGEIRNEGEEPAAIVIAAISPGVMPAPVSGTPTAG